MRHDKLKQELNMLLLLLQDKPKSNSELCKLTGLSRRNVYYYLTTFGTNSEFILTKTPYGYNISPQSKFITKLLASLGLRKSRYEELRKIINEAEERVNASEKAILLREAIANKRIVKIMGYSSSHSRSVKDRLVEPFMILDNGIEVRCYEISSKMCKTFRISRMKEVKILDTNWVNENRHKLIYTDIFLFSSEELTHIKLRMGRVAYNTLTETFPKSVPFISETTDDNGNESWLLETDVCSLEGVARFVLQNIDDVQILQGEGLTEYVRSKIDAFLQQS